MKAKRWGRWLAAGGVVAVIVLVALTQCTRVVVKNTLTRPRAALVWPAPTATQPARIRFLAEIREVDDLFVREPMLGVLSFLAGRADRSFGVPYDIHVTPDDLLLVTDPGRGLVHYIDMRRRRYERLTRLDAHGTLQQPIGVTTDPEGFIYVSDATLNNVYVFDREGAFVRPLAGAGVFARPADLAFAPGADLLYVVDVPAHQVKAVRRDGTLVRTIGARGPRPQDLNFPTHLCATPDGLVVVNSALDFAIKTFTGSGDFVGTFGQEGDTPGYFSRPKGVATDRAGHIYVADAILDRVQIFDPTGNLLLAFGESGAGPGEFWLPAGVFIDHRDRVWVADQQNRRIQVFEIIGSEAP